MGFLDKAKQAAKQAQQPGGLMDKAKQAAQQAQQKLDEAQGGMNQRNAPGQGPAVEYDKHGRPIPQEPAAAPPQAAPPAPAPPSAATAPTPPAPAAAPAAAAPPAQPAAEQPAQIVEEEIGHGGPEAAPGPPPHGQLSEPAPTDPNTAPTMTSGDPLAG